MACLNKVVQVAARSFSCKQFGEVLLTDERCCASLTKHPDNYQALLNVLTDDDVFLGLPCKQFGDID